jgi:hypothetical protein
VSGAIVTAIVGMILNAMKKRWSYSFQAKVSAVGRGFESSRASSSGTEGQTGFVRRSMPDTLMGRAKRADRRLKKVHRILGEPQKVSPTLTRLSD